jgi:hypothetical protein
MEARKTGKKKDPFVEDSNPNSNMLLYTTAQLTNVIKSWK